MGAVLFYWLLVTPSHPLEIQGSLQTLQMDPKMVPHLVPGKSHTSLAPETLRVQAHAVPSMLSQDGALVFPGPPTAVSGKPLLLSLR